MLLMTKDFPHPSGPTKMKGSSDSRYDLIILASLWLDVVWIIGGLVVFFMSSNKMF